MVIQWVGLHAFTAKGTTSISSWELRSHKPCGVAKKKKKNSGLQRAARVGGEVSCSQLPSPQTLVRKPGTANPGQ